MSAFPAGNLIDLGPTTQGFVSAAESTRPKPVVVICHERYGLVKHTCDLVQRFEAIWSDAALETHRAASERLYRIKARTVLIWGDSDRLMPPVYAHAFKKGIAGAQLVSIPEAGHMVIVEKTAAVVEAIGMLG